MKKQFVIMTNNKGFILPSLLLIIFVTFISITTSAIIFTNELVMTQNNIDQLKIETLIQMTYTQFNEEFPPFEQEQEEVHYLFPYGDVKITYTILNDSQVNLYFFVQTDNDDIYTVTKLISI